MLPSGSGTEGRLIAFLGRSSPRLGCHNIAGFQILQCLGVKMSISYLTSLFRMSTEAPLQVHTTQKNTQDFCKVTRVKQPLCPV